MKKIFIFIIGFIILFTCNVSAAEYNVSTETELINALSTQTESDKININNDIKITGLLTITGNVTINGNNHILEFDDSYVGKLFTVSGTLELNNLKLFGNNSWSWINLDDKFNPDVLASDTTINKSSKIFNNNIIEVTGTLKLTNSKIYDYYIDGAIADTNSFIRATGAESVVIVDSSVVDNLYGSFIFMNLGKVYLNNNTQIINSYGLGNKGSLFKINNGELVINKATFKDNCGVARSGSLIGAVNNSLVTFNDGLIDHNIAKYHGSASTGSMITLESGAGFIMNGGVITNNVGTLSSVLATRWTNAPDDKGIFLNGGVIKNNTTTKTTWLNASVFLRSSAVISKDMIIDGDVVVNNTNASLENNGTINGKLTLNDSTSKAVNNGTIKDVDFLKGEFINNNIINNAYELNTQITNNGDITDNYIKELSDIEGKVIVEFDINEGKEINTGYTIIDKVYDLNYKFTEEDILEVEKQSYTFDGWFLDSEFTNKFETDIDLTENITIYAKWEKIPEIVVPDTYLGVNNTVIIVGVLLIILGSVIMYITINKNNIYE